MKNDNEFPGKKSNAVMAITFIIFLGFIAISINSIFRGMGQHETWRIVIAAVSGTIFLTFLILLCYTFVKNKSEAVHE